MRQSLILLMAGSGKRVGLGYNKLMYEVNNKKLFEYSLETFSKFDLDIILVVSKEDFETVKKIVSKNIKVILGGETRNESVLNGLKEVKTERVLIHDCARCLVSEEIIEKCINSKSDLYYVACPLKDTIREKETNKTLKRENLVSVQTPQGGNTSLFLEYEKNSTTDDISSFESLNYNIEIIEGSDYNFKVTTKFDIEVLKALVKEK